MIPFADTHCHLLAGLDDGPQNDEEALAMCRMACEEGITVSTALAHQNEHYPDNTPERIRTAAKKLQEMLRAERIPLTVFPSAEVMVSPEIETQWQEGRLLTLADRRQYLLVEMPHGLFVDLRQIAVTLRRDGVRILLAHPERHPEFLYHPERIEELIRIGCLVQVSTGSITSSQARVDARALRHWFKRGLVHCLGTDGHSPRRRAPKMAEAYGQVVRWVGESAADPICSTNGTAILHGLPLRVPMPKPRRWYSRLSQLFW